MPGPMILALDPATTCGFAYGRPGDEPEFGARDFTGPGGNGEVIGKFRLWLLEMCSRQRVQMIVFESPYVPRPKKWKPGEPPPRETINPLTLRRLYALAGEVEAVAWQLRLECLEATTAEICKFFTGTSYHGGRDNKKAAIIARARQYGWDTLSDDAADALALWAMAENIVDPALSSRRGDGALFLPQPEPVEVQPRARRGRRRGAAQKPSPPVQQPLFA
jgi:hypothetical protein